MKKLIILFAATCLFAACDKNENADFIAQYFFGGDKDPDAPNKGDEKKPTDNLPQTGLVAYYPFEGNANDISGNDLNGEFRGGIFMTSSRKSDAYACGFTGVSNTYVQVPYSSALRLNNFTINAWAYNLSPSRGDGTIIQRGKRDNVGAFSLEYNHLYITDSEKSNYRVPLFDNEDEQPTSREWHMFTVTVQENLVAVYLDGHSMVYGRMNAPYKCSITDDLHIGISDFSTTTDAPFYGYIDDIRIYNRVLSQTEINALYKE